MQYHQGLSLLTTGNVEEPSIDWFNRGPGGATRQAAALRREGVTVRTGALGELTIDLGIYGWFPSMLPSEEAENSESEGEGDA